MKPYLLITLLCCALVLLFPLSALPSPEAPPAPATPTLPEPAAPSGDGETFKVLAGDTVYTYAVRDFLIYTVAAEMPASYPTEALKAQAVASYTYYTYQKQQNQNNEAMHGADFSAVPASFPKTYSPEGLKEVWGNNYDQNLQKIADAVNAVYGYRLTYNDKPILAAYHACNSGKTETAAVVWGSDLPYLTSVDSPDDKAYEKATSTVTVDDASFKAAFPSAVLSGDAGKWIQKDPICSPAGTVTALVVGNKTFTGKEVREALGLRSANFRVTHDANGFTFTVSGNGHAVGMSQVGAAALAKKGETYADILHHYYTNVKLTHPAQ